jgi:hypothetical protein
VLTSGKEWEEIFEDEREPRFSEHRYLSKFTSLADYLRGLEGCIFDPAPAFAAAPTGSREDLLEQDRSLAALMAILLSPFLIFLAFSMSRFLLEPNPPHGRINDFPLIQALQSPTLQARIQELRRGGLTPVLGLNCCQNAKIPSKLDDSSGVG